MSTAAPDRDRFESMRQAMVASQLRTTAVNDPRVVEAMARMPREVFVPREAQAFAYLDHPLALGGGRSMNIPMATGRLLTQAGVRADDHVLLVGAASGYAAALLAMLARSVVALEEDAALLELARPALAGWSKVTVAAGPLAAGWPGDAPYDVIVIDGAVEHVPDALSDQLRPGGRLATGLLDRGITRLAVGRKSERGFGLSPFADCEAVPLPGFALPKPFRF